MCRFLAKAKLAPNLHNITKGRLKGKLGTTKRKLGTARCEGVLYNMSAFIHGLLKGQQYGNACQRFVKYWGEPKTNRENQGHPGKTNQN